MDKGKNGGTFMRILDSCKHLWLWFCFCHQV